MLVRLTFNYLICEAKYIYGFVSHAVLLYLKKISVTILFYIVVSEYCYSFLKLHFLIERIIF